MGFWIRRMICFGLLVVLTAPFFASDTDPFDGSPPLTGWVPVGGDPCGEGWQGVNCVFSNITELRLNGMNLGGVLDESIVNFESIIALDLSNNHIGGSIPSTLPPTLRNFSLSGNQFSGSIPHLSMLTQLLDLSLNDNHLSDGIPDSFQQLNSLINLDLSGNNLNGQLPPSFGNLSSLSMLHLQNNTLSGKLDVLQDLPLLDLNVENNLFSGPIPPKLLNIRNFRKDGNPFNTTILAPPPVALPPFLAGAPFLSPSPGQGYGGQANGPSVLEPPLSEKEINFWSNKLRLTWIAVSGVLALVVLVVGLLVWRCSKGRQPNENNEKHGMDALQEPKAKPSHNNKSSFQPTAQMEKDSGRMAPSLKLQDEHVIDVMKMPTNLRNKKDHEKSTVPAPPCPPVEGIIVNPVAPTLVKRGGQASTSQNSAFSPSIFTIASLQQYTNSFSEENFIGEGMLGSVYRAELPDGKLLAIKKLDSKPSGWWNEEDFVELVSSISKLKHPNILEFMGYCNEHGQQLLVYEYCKRGSLYDALHVDDEVHRKLSWDARVRVALGAARALQYLHEVCQPPIMHRNLKSSNVLLDDKFAARVSDCILAPLSSSADQLSGSLISSGYGAAELELGSYTCQSDVYSLGIVMLELLTGRKPFDRSRSRGEQSLVGWAIPKLHDIDALSKMVDPTLNGAYPVKSLSRFADIISRCAQWEPGFRPPIAEIVQDLLQMI